jgi:hypothetical protein
METSPAINTRPTANATISSTSENPPLERWGERIDNLLLGR